MEEVTIQELIELGFVNPKQESIEETIEELYRQFESNQDLAMRMIQELSEYSGLNGYCKDNHSEVLDNWIIEKSDYLHGDHKL